MSGAIRPLQKLDDHVAMSLLKDKLNRAADFFSSQGRGPDSLWDQCVNISLKWSFSLRTKGVNKDILQSAASLVNRHMKAEFGEKPVALTNNRLMIVRIV